MSPHDIRTAEGERSRGVKKVFFESKQFLSRNLNKRKKKEKLLLSLLLNLRIEKFKNQTLHRSSLPPASFLSTRGKGEEGNSSTLVPIPSFTRYTRIHERKAKETRSGRRSSSSSKAENRHRKWNERGKSQRGLEERRWRLQAWPSGG